MNQTIKTPVLVTIIVAIVIVVGLIGYKVTGPSSGGPKHQLGVYLKLSDLVKLQRDDPSKLTPDQKKYLDGLPDSVKQKALNQTSAK